MNRRDPFRTTLIASGLLVAGGLLAIALGKRIVAGSLDVYEQVPAFVSGGIGGLALVIAGCAIAYIQVGRWCGERERAAQRQVIALVSTLGEEQRAAALLAATPTQTRRRAARPRKVAS